MHRHVNDQKSIPQIEPCGRGSSSCHFAAILSKVSPTPRQPCVPVEIAPPTVCSDTNPTEGSDQPFCRSSSASNRLIWQPPPTWIDFNSPSVTGSTLFKLSHAMILIYECNRPITRMRCPQCLFKISTTCWSVRNSY